MRYLASGALCVALAVSLVAGALSLIPGGPGDWRLGLPDLRAALDEAERADRLAEGIEAALRRTAAKHAAAAEVADGRLTLLEAAARFRDTDADVTPEYRKVWRLTMEGGSDEERFCRQVLLFVEQAVWGRADGPALLGRLRAELDEALAGGGVRLPAPEAPGAP